MAKQITEKQTEQLIERLVEKMQNANELFLKDIGSKLKKIKELKPSEAHKLIQILKYGEDTARMTYKISQYADNTIDEIDTMFYNYAKKDQQFYEQFYKYRGIPFVEYEKNSQLIKQTEAIARMVKQEIYDYTRQNVLGYTVADTKGNLIFKGLREVYNDLLDTAYVNVGQGKDTFDSAMRSILKEIGSSGLKTVNYESGRAVRLDSVIRMHLQNRLNELHNENQMLFGEEFGSNGVEISVHEYPAPDHADVQGKQFSTNEYDVNGKLINKGEWEKLQDGSNAKDYNGNNYNLYYGNNTTYRPIGEMNCYHTIFSIILGVSEPEYTNEQLQAIKEANEKGFEFEGKHYTMYEGTQLQRRLEREIRQQKDIQILGRASNDNIMVSDAQDKITVLTNKYNSLTKASGLPTKKNRLSVSGYHKVKANRQANYPTNPVANSKYNATVQEDIPEFSLEEEFYMLQGDLADLDVDVDSYVYALKNEKLRNVNLEQLYRLRNKYHYTEFEDLKVTTGNKYRNWYAWTNKYENKITFNYDYYDSEDKLLKSQRRNRETKWNYNIEDKDLDIYTITHEFGHTIENDYIKHVYKYSRDYSYWPRKKAWDKIDLDLQDLLIANAKRISGEKLTKTEFKAKYFSGYGKSKRHAEWFAELFAQHELGEWTPFTQALDEWLKGKYY